MRTVKKHPNDKPWITSTIKDTIKKRQQAWAKGDSQEYRVCHNKVIKLCKKARQRFYADKISHTYNTDPKKWWNSIKMLSGLSNAPPISSLTRSDTILEDVDLAESINESFSRVKDGLSPLTFTPIPVSQVPDDYVISPESVERALLTVQERKSVGPDEIPNWLLKTCAPVISSPVCSIFNSSIREGHVPKLWKSADVVPLGKNPQPQSIDSDLRPISLTPVLSKILEGFVFNWITPIVMPYIDPYQFGNVKKSSTTHALVHLLHYWLTALEEPNTFIRTCLIDFSKAFDRIDHNILLHKLKLLNVPPVLLNWCASFLHDRQQRVKLQNCKSNWRTINAGVPQGTKLGPLFFLIMVNDLTSKLPLYKYVDDCVLSEVVKVDESEQLSLEQEVVNVNRWSIANNMMLNVKKTKEFIVSFLSNQPLLQPLQINNQHLETIYTTKLLGLYLTSDLKWTKHVDHICSKASKRLYALRLLKRNGVQSRDLRKVYCSFVRPVLEYACPVWHSSLSKSLSDQIEHIQIRALKIILSNTSYHDSLDILKLPTLAKRRELLCKRFYKKIHNDTSNKLFELLPKPIKNEYNLRHARNIPLFKSRTKRFSDSCLPYCVRKWDSF